MLAILTQGEMVGQDSLSSYPPLAARVLSHLKNSCCRMPEEVFLKFTTKYSNIRESLELQKSMHTLDRLLKLTTQLQSIKIETEDVKHIHEEVYQPNDVIFYLGSVGDAIYVILEGEVKVVKQHGPEDKVIAKLGAGQLFGEISLIKEQARAATIIADQVVRVLRIDKVFFKKWYALNPVFRAVLDSLKHIYHLQNDSLIFTYADQYNGKDSINTIRTQADGSTFISIKVLDVEDTSIFIKLMKDGDAKKIKRISYQTAEGGKRELQLLDNILIGIVFNSPWPKVPQVIELILKGQEIPSWRQELFSKHGEIDLDHGSELIFDRTIICKCMQVTYSDIGRAINEYGNDYDRIIAATGATLVCGACSIAVNDLLGKTQFIDLKIKETSLMAHSAWSIKLESVENDLPPFKPGQHIILMVKIADEWVQRSYTLISQVDKRTWEIVVLRQSLGTMSPILTGDHPDGLQIKATPPRGNFTITSELSQILFFASGIGVTPALAFLNAKTPGFFLHYSATSEDAFVCKKELEKHPNVVLRNTRKEGDLTFAEIKALYEDHPNAEIMICGSDKFYQALREMLIALNVPSNHIKYESFSPDQQQAKKTDFSSEILTPYFASKNAGEVELFLNDVYAYVGLPDLFASRLKAVTSEIKQTGRFVPMPEEINRGIKKILTTHKISIDNVHILDRRMVASQSQREGIIRDHQFLTQVSAENIVITILPQNMEVKPGDYSITEIEITPYCHLQAMITLPTNIMLNGPLRYTSTTNTNVEPLPTCYPKQEKWPIIGIFFRLRDILFRPIEMIIDARKEYGSAFKISVPSLKVSVIGTKPFHDLLDMPAEVATRGPIMMVVPTVGFWFKRTNIRSAEWMQSLLLATRRHIAEKIVDPIQLSKMSPIIKAVVKKHVDQWDDKIDLSTSLIRLIYDASCAALVQSELWNDIREETIPLLRAIANGIDIPRAGVGKSPIKFFMPEYYATKKLEKIINRVLKEHRTNKKYPYFDMLATLQVDGKPLPAEDLGWYFMYVIWNAVTYPGSYGVWTIAKILSDPKVYNDLKKQKMVDRQILLGECFTETIRLFPVSLLVRDISCPVDFKHENKTYRIPKRTFLGVFPRAMCYDKETYSEPEKFNPYRYSAGEKIPEVFATGPFSCIAMQYSHLLLTTIMNELFNYLDFELLSKVEWPQCRVHPLYPKKPIWVALRKEKSVETHD